MITLAIVASAAVNNIGQRERYKAYDGTPVRVLTNRQIVKAIAGYQVADRQGNTIRPLEIYKRNGEYGEYSYGFVLSSSWGRYKVFNNRVCTFTYVKSCFFLLRSARGVLYRGKIESGVVQAIYPFVLDRENAR